jgi:hypothetical protein
MRPAKPQLTRDSARLAEGDRSNSSSPKFRTSPAPGNSLPNSFTRPSVNRVTPRRSSARHAANLESSSVKSGCPAAPASISASVAASRRPRLNPCPATGCNACAALPMSTTRPDAVSVARDSSRGYVLRRPILFQRPARQPNAASNSSANAFSSSAMSSVARSGRTAQMTA